MTKQRIIGILSLLVLVATTAASVLKGSSVDYTTAITGFIAGLTAVLHPSTDSSASTSTAK